MIIKMLIMISLVFSSSFALNFTLPLATTYSSNIKWLQSIEVAKQQANSENKPILVIVLQENCSACERLGVDIDNTPALQNTLKRYVVVALDLQDASRSGYEVVKTPTIFIETPNGTSLVPPLEGAPTNIYEFLDYLTKIELLFCEIR